MTSFWRVPLWTFWKTEKNIVLSLLSPGEKRPENSCRLAVYSNLEALLQTLWFTAGLKHFQHPSRVIKKQVESDEFEYVVPERGPEKNMNHRWCCGDCSKYQRQLQLFSGLFLFSELILTFYQHSLTFQTEDDSVPVSPTAILYFTSEKKGK